jgi:hypothetical protein
MWSGFRIVVSFETSWNFPSITRKVKVVTIRVYMHKHTVTNIDMKITLISCVNSWFTSFSYKREDLGYYLILNVLLKICFVFD